MNITFNYIQITFNIFFLSNLTYYKFFINNEHCYHEHIITIDIHIVFHNFHLIYYFDILMLEYYELYYKLYLYHYLKRKQIKINWFLYFICIFYFFLGENINSVMNILNFFILNLLIFFKKNNVYIFILIKIIAKNWVFTSKKKIKKIISNYK